jgi:protein SCO1/2
MKRAAALAISLLLLASAAACKQQEPVKRYPMTGQIISIDTQHRELTINHKDIPNFMPGMTMAYPVATPSLMDGRSPGELITAVLAVDKTGARLVEITHVGSAALPANANQAAMASGILDAGDEIPDTAFIDQDNRRRSLSEWKGTALVLTFTYTRCPLPNFCPLMDQNFATLQRRLADDTAMRGRVHLLTLTFDPEHDTPDVLKKHAAKLKADPAVWTFLTGDAVTVERFAGKFGIGVLRDAQTPGEIAHNLRTAIIGPDQRIVKVYSGNEWTPGAVLADLRDIVK